MTWEERMGALSISLPEDILKAKWAGDFAGAQALIDCRLQRGDLMPMMRDRLEIEREILKRLPGQYPYSREKALRLFTEKIPDFTEADFDRLERDGALDYLYFGGEKRYFQEVLETLLRVHPEIRRRAGLAEHEKKSMLQDTVSALKADGEQRWRVHIRHTLSVKDEAFIPNETYLVHMPLPKPCAQTECVRLMIADQDAQIGPEAQPQRTVAYRRALEKNAPFTAEYEFENVVRYVDPLAEPQGDMPVYPGALPPKDEDLAELPTHMCFTPYLRHLAAELMGEETAPVKIARRFYEYVTTKVKYSFVREYFLIDNGAEYAALNLKGDCGIQALLFITLCRIAGIPARWQSGLYTAPTGVGNHDWAQFYVEPFGWLFCDCSFGGSAWRRGDMELWNFYFGNLDPYRLVANDAYQGAFDPPKRAMRIDPYDNQCGECECGQKGFVESELNAHQFELIELTRMD